MFELPTAWLLTYLCHSTVLLGIAWGLTVRLGSDRLALQERLWRAALLGAVMTATLQLVAGWSSPLLAHGGSPGKGALAEVTTVVPSDDTRGATTVAGANPPGRTVPAGVPWRSALAGLWLTGALALGGRLLHSRRRLARRLAGRRRLLGGRLFELFRSLVRPLGSGGEMLLASSEELEVPIARGVVRREVCLPGRLERELCVEQQETVLAHEVAHLARRDPTWLLVYRLVEAVLYLQPLNRLAVRRLEEIAEYRCDDWAVEQTGRPLALARCLTRVADWTVRSSGAIPVPTMGARGSGLERRVRRLLDREKPSADGVPRWLPFAVAGALVATAVLVPGVTPLRAGAAEAPPAPPPPEAPVLAAVDEPARAPEAPEPPEPPERVTAVVAPAAFEAPPSSPAVAAGAALASGEAPPSPPALPRLPTAPRPELAPAPTEPAPSSRPHLAPSPPSPGPPAPPQAVFPRAPSPSTAPGAPVAPAVSASPPMAVLASPPGSERPVSSAPRGAAEIERLEDRLQESLSDLGKRLEVLEGRLEELDSRGVGAEGSDDPGRR